MSGRKPKVFLSSTCYDLRQIRQDLAHFLEDHLGCTALASERSSFPVDPDLDTIDNCRKVVQDEADSLILVVGGRYGSVIEDTNKSVTNIEYLAARAKGIPIFVFVQKNILANLPTWESNPEADFSQTVDSSRLFEFVTSLRRTDGVWTFPFETAQDIIETLRTQFSYLIYRGLVWQRQLREQEPVLQNLTGETFRLALEQPDGWEGLLFASALIDEVAASRDQRLAYDTGIAFGPGEVVPFEIAFEWIRSKSDEMLRLIEGITTLMNNSLSSALDSSNAEVILYSARQLGHAYRHAIEWANHLRRVFIDERFKNLLSEFSLAITQLLKETERFGPLIQKRIKEVLSDESDEPKTLKLTFKIAIENAERMNNELERLSHELNVE